jgi:phosphoglycolate phosphatase
MQPGGKIQAVLFDLDGTLVETEIDFAGMRQGSLDAARRHGAPAEDLAGRDALGIIAAVSARLVDPAPFQEEVEQILCAIELRACATARAMPGAANLLAWLEGCAIRTSIVTRNCRPAAEEALARAGLPWALLLTRADVPRVKPDPLHLLLAAERLGAAPEATLMVGDHPMDVQAGRAAGMRTAGFWRAEGARDRLRAEEPDLLIGELGELAAWISPPCS